MWSGLVGAFGLAKCDPLAEKRATQGRERLPATLQADLTHTDQPSLKSLIGCIGNHVAAVDARLTRPVPNNRVRTIKLS